MKEINILLVSAYLLVLGAIAYTDWQRKVIPDGLAAVIGVLGMMAAALCSELSMYQRLAGMFCVSVPLLLITLITQGAFGGGDIKLVTACGIFLGWRRCLAGAVIAVMAAGIYVLCLLAAKKADRKTYIAFGPFLCLGMAAACIWYPR